MIQDDAHRKCSDLLELRAFFVLGIGPEREVFMGKRLLATGEAAEFLGVKPATLEFWRCRGGGPNFRKLGARVVRYAVEDLERFAKVRSSTSETAG